MNIILITLGVIAVILVYAIATYNSLIVLKTRIQEALSGIDVQLKRRSDLIPNLVETVKGYAKHEKEVFENVTKARTAMLSAGTLDEKAHANDMITGALKSLFAVAEAYPDLKANTQFQELQRQLEDTEDKVSYSRQFYNTNVLDYNSKVAIFPNSIIAAIFSFTPLHFFEAAPEERERIKVSF